MTPSVYIIRLSARAANQIEVEHASLELPVGADVADAWEDELTDATASRATLPQRCVLAPENDLFQRINSGPLLRQRPYHRTRSGPI